MDYATGEAVLCGAELQVAIRPPITRRASMTEQNDVLWQGSSDCSAQSPREGYITAPDGVRLFYKVVGSGPKLWLPFTADPAIP